MSCYPMQLSNAIMSAEQRAALDKLRTGLTEGRVRVKLDRKGKASLVGWSDAAGLCDGCVVAMLEAEGSAEYKRARRRAEAFGEVDGRARQINGGGVA